MWIVLLDHSDSMSEPFEADAQQIKAMGRVRSVEAENKWQAAKKSFLLELKRLPGDMEVLLYGFTSSAQLLHSGSASQIDEFERRLESIRPFNGTDIAQALNSLFPHAAGHPQVLLITDGKSDLDAAKREAHACAEAGIRVDVLIIDPTHEGVEMASAIAGITHGRWDPVTSAEQLEKRTQEVAEEHAEVAARAEEILQAANSEYEELETSTQDKTRVTFSAGYPSRIQMGHKYPLLVYIHLDELKQEIEEYIKKEIAASGATPSSSSAASATRIPRGALITVRPSILDIFTNPPQQEVVWMEDYHRVSFEMRYAGASRVSVSCSGFIDILANGVPVGHIPISLAVEAESASLLQPTPTAATGNPFARIFASYAREDSAIVQACKETYRSLGIHLYVDRDDLLSGQLWRPTLQKLIAKSDLFQLYWSAASADSTAVAEEWRLALLVGSSREGDFIRPLYWQPRRPSPPKELKHLNFALLDLNKLQIPPDDSHPEKEQQTRNRLDEAIFPVISLTGKDTRAFIDILQKSIGEVTSYLEWLTGLRYYPPATLLVEEYIVKAVRSHLVVDPSYEPGEAGLEVNIEFVLEILQALALNFHVHSLEPEGYHEEKWQKEYYALETSRDFEDFRHVRSLCEYIFAYPVKKHLAGEDPFQQQSRNSIEQLNSEIDKRITTYQVDDWIDFTLREEVGHFHGVATRDDQKKIEQIIGPADFSALMDHEVELSDEQRRRVAAQCLSGAYLAVTQKYRIAFYDFFTGGETTLCRANTFPEYLDKWFQLWLAYLKTSVEQHDVEITSRYRVSAEALQWLRAGFPDVKFSVRPDWTISARTIYKVVGHLKPLVMDALHKRKSAAQMIRQYFVANASTYGIYASAESRRASQDLLQIARKQNWPEGLALEGLHKILLCTNAIERYQSELIAVDMDPQEAETMATWFLIATLVHEHFHAILATGIDRQGKGSWASRNWSEWQKGDALNESLAAWVERHYFRDNEAMSAAISEYIQSGSYPDWPYQGAEKVEEIFKTQGMLGIRALINRLRDDPQLAQETFDELAL